MKLLKLRGPRPSFRVLFGARSCRFLYFLQISSSLTLLPFLFVYGDVAVLFLAVYPVQPS